MDSDCPKPGHSAVDGDWLICYNNNGDSCRTITTCTFCPPEK